MVLIKVNTCYASIRLVSDCNKILPFLCLNRVIATVGFILKQGIGSATSGHINLTVDFLKHFFSKHFPNKTLFQDIKR